MSVDNEEVGIFKKMVIVSIKVLFRHVGVDQAGHYSIPVRSKILLPLRNRPWTHPEFPTNGQKIS
jgi:hypothetical protein